eukprot:3373926-Rhodomonas_salina.1
MDHNIVECQTWTPKKGRARDPVVGSKGACKRLVEAVPVDDLQYQDRLSQYCFSWYTPTRALVLVSPLHLVPVPDDFPCPYRHSI